jgi:large subunit ribosomal protein L2
MDKKRLRRLTKKLLKIKKKKSGRDSSGRVSVRHQGGEHKRFLRKIDWRRNKKDIPGKIESIEYDPNRNANVAVVLYPDGERRLILAPEGVKRGDEVISGDKVPINPGNAMPLKNIPIGVPIHNIEIVPGKGGQLVRGAGALALIKSKDKKGITVRMPSGEMRIFNPQCMATIGQVGNAEFRTIKLTKAGDSRHRGIRPTVRGVAQHPDSHPHGGGEGRSSIGMPSPKSPWGKKTLGVRTRKKGKYSDKLIVKRRKKR